MYKKLLSIKPDYYVYLALLITVGATLGSLYYSLVLRLAPCELCWYQRIMMYPMALTLFVGTFRKDSKVFQYTIVPNIIGFLVAMFHLSLSQGLLPAQFSRCFYGPSCTTDFSSYFGFFTIPLQSFTAFTILLLITRFHYLASKFQSGNQHEMEI